MIYWKKIINSIVLVLLLISVLSFLTIPSFREINRINQVIIDQETDLKKLYLQGQLLKKVKQQLLEIKPLISQLSNKFIQPEHGIQFITQLESLAINNNVQQEINFKTNQKRDEGFYQIMPIQLNVRGEFKNLIYFLRDLQQDHYYLTIDSINIFNSAKKTVQSIEGINQISTMDLILNAQSYWLSNK